MSENSKSVLPRELSPEALKNSGTVKIIEPPKGKISSMGAFMLQQRISDQLQLSSTSPLTGHQKVKKI